jgi:quercetin dioxygenase-like cupin family protein
MLGEIEATVRREKSVVRTGETLSIPANAPHSVTNAFTQAARLLCVCAPSPVARQYGTVEFFTGVA